MVHPHSTRPSWFVTLTVILFAVLMAACTPEPPAPTPTPSPTATPEQIATPTHTPTLRPSPTPTLPPLGTSGNPITFGFILPATESADIAAADLATLLGEETGYTIEALFYPDFDTLSTAVLNNEVHLYWLGPLEYLYLNSEGAAEVMVVANHLGVFAYGVQFLANVNRGFAAYYNPEENQSLGDSINALQQFSGTRPCFLEPGSIVGYHVPLGLLAGASTPTLAPVFTYSYNATIRALYISGICDFGVTYALTGDPLTASDILINLPDAPLRIRTIWQSEGIIPNLNLSASPSLPVFIGFRLEEALLRIADTPQGLNLLKTALDYEVEGFRSVEDHFYNPLRAALAPLELDLRAITHQNAQQ